MTHPSALPDSLIVVDWYRTLKSRNRIQQYQDHLSVENIYDLESHKNTCPLICKKLLESHPNLLKGIMTTDDLELMDLRAKQREIIAKLEQQKHKKTHEAAKKIMSELHPSKKLRTSLNESDLANRFSIEERVYKRCDDCFDEIKRGAHKNCSYKIGAASNIVRELTKREIHEPVAAKIIQQTFSKNTTNGSLNTFNGRKLTISTKTFKIRTIPINECIDLMRRTVYENRKKV